MKISTEGLTLGAIKALEDKGYKVELDDNRDFATISKEVVAVTVPAPEGWGSMGEYL